MQVFKQRSLDILNKSGYRAEFTNNGLIIEGGIGKLARLMSHDKNEVLIKVSHVDLNYESAIKLKNDLNEAMILYSIILEIETNYP